MRVRPGIERFGGPLLGQGGIADGLLAQLEGSIWKHASGSAQGALLDSLEIQWLPVRSLAAGDSPRLAGEDLEHTAPVGGTGLQ